MSLGQSDNHAFIQFLTDLYRELLKQDSRVLDLCGSFDSHLPPPEDFPLSSVIGHGMNDAELAANPRLDSFFKLNLNGSNDTSALESRGGGAPAFPLGKGQVSIPYFLCITSP